MDNTRVGHFPPAKQFGLILHGVVIMLLAAISVWGFLNLTNAFLSHISYKKERGEIDKNLCIHLLFLNYSSLSSLFIQFKIKIVMSTTS
jgi:hypothetical protein